MAGFTDLVMVATWDGVWGFQISDFQYGAELRGWRRFLLFTAD